jgi:GTP-binding protein
MDGAKMETPTIAIVGRPNVGKSTLFNRLVGGRRAIVDDQPGVTRDRLYGVSEWRGRRFAVVDTGGFEPATPDPLMAAVEAQARVAIEEADCIFFLVDGQAGLNPADAAFARILREEATRPVLLVVNKVDSVRAEPAASEFYRLGFERLFAVSAEQGLGVGDLLDAAEALLPQPAAPREEHEAVTVAVVGRPNVGKSSLVNRLLGLPRVIVNPEPGTTRDAVDTPLTVAGRPYVLVDTAGIRAKRKVGYRVEAYSVLRALRSIDRCDVAILVLDATAGVVEQDQKIAATAAEAGCGLILAVNKWDAAPRDVTADEFALELRGKFQYCEFAPIVTCSALTGLRVARLFPLVARVAAERERRIGTGELNRVLAEIVERTPPPTHKGRPVKIRYVTQSSTRPPTFILFTNLPQGLPPSYRRFLARRLRERYGFAGTPIRLLFRRGSGREAAGSGSAAGGGR